ncbi:hypothetical protein [Egicoccus sp. AB-alg2]|uniref:hypothetical protein n=1 Tax=Egicoccus sp. AB-alg2 TaxID=3242693 RepID=UPI00359DFD55
MTRGTGRLFGFGDRLVTTILGLILAAAGAAVLLAAAGVFSLPTTTELLQTTEDLVATWPPAAVVAVAVVVAILGLVLVLRHLLPARRPRAVTELDLATSPGPHRTRLRGAALAKAVERDLARGPDVREVTARVVDDEPVQVEARVATSVSSDLTALREHAAAVSERMAEALGRSDCRLHLRVRFVDAADGRVQ